MSAIYLFILNQNLNQTSPIQIFLYQSFITFYPNPNLKPSKHHSKSSNFKINAVFLAYYIVGSSRSFYSKYFIDIHKVLAVQKLQDERLVTQIVNSSSLIRIIFIVFGGYLFAIFGVKNIHFLVFALTLISCFVVISVPFTPWTFAINTYFANVLYGFNSMLNANTLYSLFPQNVALEANSYYCFIYLTYNIFNSLLIWIVGDAFDYKKIVTIMIFFKLASLAFMLTFRGFKEDKQLTEKIPLKDENNKVKKD